MTTVTIPEDRYNELVRAKAQNVDLREEAARLRDQLARAMAQIQLVEKDRNDLAKEVAELREGRGE